MPVVVENDRKLLLPEKNTYLDFITRMAKQLSVVLNFLFFKGGGKRTVTAISNVQKHMLPESVLL